jgi:hypothetical protein
VLKSYTHVIDFLLTSVIFSDDDTHDEDADGIQKLLQSSLSPRHSPMPFHHQLRQSIRSSMLKEVSTFTIHCDMGAGRLLHAVYHDHANHARPI